MCSFGFFRLAFVLLLLAACNASAADGTPNRQEFRFFERTVFLRHNGDPGELLSENCLADGRPRCLAQDALEKASFKGLEYLKKDRWVNLGGAVCTRKQLNGRVEVGRDSSGEDHSFCLFEDGSIVDNEALYKRALKNDDERELFMQPGFAHQIRIGK